MEMSLSDFYTLRLFVWAILIVPFVVLVCFVPFVHALSKSAREWISIFGFFAGTIGNGVLAIESGYRAIETFLYFVISNNSPEKYNPKYIVFGLIFFGGSWLTWQLVKVFDYRFFKKKKRFGR